MPSSIPADSATIPNAAEILELREQFSKLSTDYYILNGQFGADPSMKEFTARGISWYKLESRCNDLKMLAKNLGPQPGTLSVANVSTEYATLLELFEQIKDDLAALKVQLEGAAGHEYLAGVVTFQIIGRPVASSAKSQAHATGTPGAQNGRASTPRGAISITSSKFPPPPSSQTGCASRHQTRAANAGEVRHKKRPSKPRSKVISSPALRDDVVPNPHVIDPPSKAKSKSSSPLLSGPSMDVTNHPGARPSNAHVTSLEDRIKDLKKTNASMKSSLRKLNMKNEALRVIIQEQTFENGRNGVEILRIQAKIKDYRYLATELAGVVNDIEPTELMDRSEMRGDRRIMNLPNSTKIWIKASKQQMELRDLDDEKIPGAGYSKRTKEEIRYSEEEQFEEDEEIDDESPPHKRRKSFRDR